MIPLELLKIKDILRDGRHIFCRVHIKNKELRMLVDTGASMTVFDNRKKISDNEQEDNEQVISAVGGSDIKSKYIIIDEMIIDDIVIKDYKTILMSLGHINSHFRINGLPLIDGILGGDILSDYKAVIDYENREMKLS